MIHWLKRLIFRGDRQPQPTGCSEVVRSGEQLDRDVFHPPRETSIGDTEPAVVLHFRWTRTERRAPVETNTKPTKPGCEVMEETLVDSPAVLELSRSYFAWAVNQREEWYSPSERRVYSRCAGETEWKAHSLLASISFRVAELYNRRKLEDAFRTIFEELSTFGSESSLAMLTQMASNLHSTSIPKVGVPDVCACVFPFAETIRCGGRLSDTF